MIFNVNANTRENRKSEHYLITDAVHIYRFIIGDSDTGANNIEVAYLLWKPTDPKEVTIPTTGTNPWVVAPTTLLIEPYCFINATDVYIPFATSISTFNVNATPSGPFDQMCFGSDTKIHVNSTLNNYMSGNSSVWGNCINNVIVDQ